MRPPFRCTAAILVFFIGTTAHGASILNAEVTHEAGRYTVRFEVLVDADVAKVRRQLTDYAGYHRLSDVIVESRVLAVHDNGRHRVRFVFQACALFFCRHFVKLADIETLADGAVMLTDPRESDFHSAEEHWHIEALAHQTRIRYDARFVPNFFVPPLIGPWLIRMYIRDELETTARRVEALARSE